MACKSDADLCSVFYEVGRISDLPSFPYADLVYERDGLLVSLRTLPACAELTRLQVGQAENGDIGLLTCSSLEPLT